MSSTSVWENVTTSHSYLNSTDVPNVTLLAVVNSCHGGIQVTTTEWCIWKVFLAVLTSVGCLVGVSTNTLVLLAIFCARRMRTLSSAFLVNMVINDLLFSACATPVFIHNIIHGSNNTSMVTCSLLSFLTLIFSMSSVLSQAFIAFDRYHAIVNCLEYTYYCSLSYIIKSFTAIYVTSIGCSIPIFFLSDSINPEFCVLGFSSSLGYRVVLLLVTYIMPVTSMTYCYGRVINIAKRHLKRIADINSQVSRPEINGHTAVRHNSLDAGSALAYAMVDPIQRLSLFPDMVCARGGHLAQPGHATGELDQRHLEGDHSSSTSTASSIGTNFRREARATVRLLGLVLLFVVCWTTFHVSQIIYAANDGHHGDSGLMILIACSISVCLMTCAMDPGVYVLGSRRFRHAIRRLIRVRKKSRTTRKHKRRAIAQQIASLYRSSGDHELQQEVGRAAARHAKDSIEPDLISKTADANQQDTRGADVENSSTEASQKKKTIRRKRRAKKKFIFTMTMTKEDVSAVSVVENRTSKVNAHRALASRSLQDMNKHSFSSNIFLAAPQRKLSDTHTPSTGLYLPGSPNKTTARQVKKKPTLSGISYWLKRKRGIPLEKTKGNISFIVDNEKAYFVYGNDGRKISVPSITIEHTSDEDDKQYYTN